MRLLARLWKPKRLPNITAYHLSAIVNGDVKSSPLGVIPRLSDDFENGVRARQPPPGTTYINDTINGVSLILFWTGREVEAVSFLSAADARAFPGFKPFDSADIAKLDTLLMHFPR